MGVILVLLDGLRLSTASRCMSCLRALTGTGQALFTPLKTCLPPISRPAYATILTGKPPVEHGILHNDDARVLEMPTIFSIAAAKGYVTCAAAYGWFYELCNSSPFDIKKDRFCDCPSKPVNYGLFYGNDSYPDAELFCDAGMLIRQYAPRLALVHSMGIDFAGHSFGGESAGYDEAVRQADALLAWHLPLWMQWGYGIIIASDHGMDASGSHYDDTNACRDVPFWLVGSHWTRNDLPARFTDIAETVVSALPRCGFRDKSALCFP